MVFLARCTLGCPSGLVVAGGGSGPAAAVPWAPGILSSLIAKLWTDGGDFPAPVIDILARLGQAPPLLGDEGNDFVAWPRKRDREIGRGKIRKQADSENPTLTPCLPCLSPSRIRPPSPSRFSGSSPMSGVAPTGVSAPSSPTVTVTEAGDEGPAGSRESVLALGRVSSL